MAHSVIKGTVLTKARTTLLNQKIIKTMDSTTTRSAVNSNSLEGKRRNIMAVKQRTKALMIRLEVLMGLIS